MGPIKDPINARDWRALISRMIGDRGRWVLIALCRVGRVRLMSTDHHRLPMIRPSSGAPVHG